MSTRIEVSAVGSGITQVELVVEHRSILREMSELCSLGDVSLSSGRLVRVGVGDWSFASVVVERRQLRQK